MKKTKNKSQTYKGLKGSYYVPDKDRSIWADLNDYLESIVPDSMKRSASKSFTAQFIIFWDLYGKQIKENIKKIGQ
jgi:hypothetical protein